MFGLEQAISKWRTQMLAAGIKTPVPLDELEIHLRDEIERQTKLELNQQEAFNVAVQRIGHGHVLQNEFNKVEAGHKTKRVIMLIIGWLAAGITLLYGLLRFDFHWDFFGWGVHPKWDSETITDIFVIFTAETGIWFLAKASRDRASRVVSLLVCLFLAGLAVVYFYYDGQPAKSHGDFGLYSRPSPLWYRGGLTFLMCLPSVFWVWRERRQIIQKLHSIRGSQPIRSS
jgi:hypothetical protein